MGVKYHDMLNAHFHFMKPIWENRSLENLVDTFEGVTYTEEWKDIPDFEGLYQISNFGRVKSLYCGREIILKHGLKHGYAGYSLQRRGFHRKLTTGHILVAKAFIPNPENKPDVNHLKGIRLDNRFHQLEWNTTSENILHAIKTGLMKTSGENSYKSKLKNKQVLEIVKSSLSIGELSKKYGVSKGNINHILTGYTWSSVTGIKHKKRKCKLSEEDKNFIISSTLSDIKLGRQFNVCKNAIRYVRQRAKGLLK